MERRDFTVIENENTAAHDKVAAEPVRQTNPIMKKFVQFRNENKNKFSVKDIFKVVRG